MNRLHIRTFLYNFSIFFSFFVAIFIINTSSYISMLIKTAIYYYIYFSFLVFLDFIILSKGYKKYNFIDFFINYPTFAINTTIVGLIISFLQSITLNIDQISKVENINLATISIAFLIFLVIDLSKSSVHAFFHSNKSPVWMKKSHFIHHSMEDMLFSKVRSHILDLLLVGLPSIFLTTILGYFFFQSTLIALVFHGCLFTITAYFQHAPNISNNSFMHKIFVTPNIHAVHHYDFMTNKNYSLGVLSIWDQLIFKNKVYKNDYSSFGRQFQKFLPKGSNLFVYFFNMLKMPFTK